MTYKYANELEIIKEFLHFKCLHDSRASGRTSYKDGIWLVIGWNKANDSFKRFTRRALNSGG